MVSFPLVGEHARNQPGLVDQAGEPLLESVAVEETPDGAAVVVRSAGGASAGSALESGMAGLDGAIVAGVAELVGRAAELTKVIEDTVDDLLVLTVLIDVGEDRPRAGAAVQWGGRAYAIARAAWAALTAPV